MGNSPAALQRLLVQLSQELDDAVYFQYPDSQVEAIQKEIVRIQAALVADAQAAFDLALRQRQAEYEAEAVKARSARETSATSAKRTDWREVLGTPVYAASPERQTTSRSMRIADLERQVAGLRFDLADAARFRESQDYIDRLRRALAEASAELDNLLKMVDNPGKRRSKRSKRKRDK